MKIFINISTLFIVVLLSACSKSKPENDMKFIEYLKVEGQCYEDHVKKEGNYTGELVHVSVKAKDEKYYTIYRGTVNLTKEMSDQQMSNFTENFYKYKLPFNIDFTKISPEVFSKSEFQLKGISNYFSDYESDKKYESTCNLKVLERLDHHPLFDSKEDKNKELK